MAMAVSFSSKISDSMKELTNVKNLKRNQLLKHGYRVTSGKMDSFSRQVATQQPLISERHSHG